MDRLRITSLAALIWLFTASVALCASGEGVWVAFPNGTTCTNYVSAPINDQTLCYDSINGWQSFHSGSFMSPSLGGIPCTQMPALTGDTTTTIGTCATTTVATHLSSPLPIAQGGTGVTTGAVVTVTTPKFTATGTYTPHAGILFAIVECVGNGGGGGGAAASGAGTSGGGGGGSGSYSRVRLTAAQIGGSQAVTVGATGTGGTVGNNTGTAGGDVSLGALCVGKGGAGGVGAAANSAGAGGAGGVAGTGDITAVGNQGTGGYGAGNGNQVLSSGGSGPSVFGGGVTTFGSGSGVFTGTAGGNYGAGGSGGFVIVNGTGAAGGTGATGIVIVTEFSDQ